MKRLFPFVLLAISVFGCCVLPAAESNSSARDRETTSAPTAVAGKYAGKWKGPENSGGDLRVTLKRDGDGPWSAEASFTYDEAEIPTRMKSVEIDGTKIRMVFSWQIQETPGQSAMTGELTGDKLQGTYETTGAAGASKGTWSLTRS